MLSNWRIQQEQIDIRQQDVVYSVFIRDVSAFNSTEMEI